jgi:hypothetical protein
VNMAYRVPTTEVLAAAVAAAIRDLNVVGSQRQLTDLVREELRRIDPMYGVTEERVRKTAINARLVKVEVESRDTRRRKRVITCPVCGSKLKRVRNRTISGGTVTIGKKCPVCPFRMGTTRRVPVRYVFVNANPRRYSFKENEQRTLWPDRRM